MQDVMFVGAVSDVDKFRYLEDGGRILLTRYGRRELRDGARGGDGGGAAHRRERDPGIHDGPRGAASRR